MLQYSCKPKAEDFTAFCQISVKRQQDKRSNRSRLAIKLIIWLVFAMVTMALLQNQTLNIDWPTVGFYTALLVLILVFYLYEKSALSKALTPEEDGFVLSKSSWQVDEQGITITGQHFMHAYHWPAIESVEQANGAVYFFVDKTQACYLPPSSFYDDKSREKLLKFAEKQMKKKA